MNKKGKVIPLHDPKMEIPPLDIAPSMEMSWDVALYILSPERLEKLKRYVAFYLAKYGKEAMPHEEEVQRGSDD